MRIILLDLNGTLVESGAPAITAPDLASETYETYLVRLLERHQKRGDVVALVTIRDQRHEPATLDRIAEQTGWSPELAYFRDQPLVAPEWKHHVLFERLVPVYGDRREDYIAVESNAETTAMYQRAGVLAVGKGDLRQSLELPQSPTRGLLHR